MARLDNLNNFLTDVADAIRNKTGETDMIPAEQFDNKINNLSISNYSIQEQQTSIAKDKTMKLTFDKKVAAVFFYIVADRHCAGYYINPTSSFWKGFSATNVLTSPQCWYNMDSGYYAKMTKVDDYSVNIYINGWGGTLNYITIFED